MIHEALQNALKGKEPILLLPWRDELILIGQIWQETPGVLSPNFRDFTLIRKLILKDYLLLQSVK